ncbi:MAG: hypothetical protein MRY21_05470 [Simkaniaceae bacterium]|nr:hypothetical protein [Simkaniaceae bacterium]
MITLPFAIHGIKKYGKNIGRIFVISKRRLTNNVEWIPENSYPFSFKDVAFEIFQNAHETRAYLADKNNRTGWIYQQLLKLYAQKVKPDLSENTLMLDSDTIFLNPVAFQREDGSPCFNIGAEYHPPYFAHMDRFLPGLKRVHGESGITHHMLFQRPVLEDLFELVESYHKLPFWKAFIRCIDRKEIYGAGCSEFEIYFNFIKLRSQNWATRLLRWTNVSKFTLLKIAQRRGYHYLSLHAHMRAGKPRARPEEL